MIYGARTPEQIRKLADVTQTTLEQHFHAPYRARYQIFTQHEPYEMYVPTIPFLFKTAWHKNCTVSEVFEDSNHLPSKYSTERINLTQILGRQPRV